jgi:hypothetical protein
MARGVEGTAGSHAGGQSAIARGSCYGGLFMGVPYVGSWQYSLLCISPHFITDTAKRCANGKIATPCKDIEFHKRRNCPNLEDFTIKYLRKAVYNGVG